jgi:hypothetical protein
MSGSTYITIVLIDDLKEKVIVVRNAVSRQAAVHRVEQHLRKTYGGIPVRVIAGPTRM